MKSSISCWWFLILISLKSSLLQGNGLMERTNCTLIKLLWAIMTGKPTNEWNQYRSRCLFAYRVAHKCRPVSPASELVLAEKETTHRPKSTELKQNKWCVFKVIWGKYSVIDCRGKRIRTLKSHFRRNTFLRHHTNFLTDSSFSVVYTFKVVFKCLFKKQVNNSFPKNNAHVRSFISPLIIPFYSNEVISFTTINDT